MFASVDVQAPASARGPAVSAGAPGAPVTWSTFAPPSSTQRARVGVREAQPRRARLRDREAERGDRGRDRGPGGERLVREDRVDRRLAAGERRRVRAQHLPPRRRSCARTPRRRGTGALKVEYATTQWSCVGERQARMWRKSPPASLPRATVTLPPSSSAETSRRRSFGLPSISSRDQVAQEERPLRMADQDDAAAVVVAREVGAPCGADVAVRRARSPRRAAGRSPRASPAGRRARRCGTSGRSGPPGSGRSSASRDRCAGSRCPSAAR